jgi:hypothetical protein
MKTARFSVGTLAVLARVTTIATHRREPPTKRVDIAIKVALGMFALILGSSGESGAMLAADNVVDVFGGGLPCQWSPVVGISSICTGAYVGNGMVLTAGHCIDDITTIAGPGNPTPFTFADTTWGADFPGSPDDPPRFEAFAVACRAHNASPEPDIGWCKLDEVPIATAPIPVLVPDRCEATWVSRQALGAAPTAPRITTVGMGSHDAGDPPSTTDLGRKRFTSYFLVGVEDGNGRLPVAWVDWDATVEDPRAASDSGGPNYVRLPDGTWRLLAVHGGFLFGTDENLKYSVPSYVSWIEKSSGVDITPCHQLDETPDGAGSPPNWGRYVYVPSAECSVAHSVDPMPTAPSDDVSWLDGGCESPASGPPNDEPPLPDECAHWPVVPSRIRSPLP